MVLKKNSSNDIFIKELKSRGLAQTHRDVLAEGDVLLSVAGVPTKPLGLTGAVDFLQTVHKPVELIFQRPSPVQDRTPPPSQEYTPSSQNRRTSTKQRTPPPSQERVRQSTMVVLPLPSDEVSNESFISDSIAAKYLSKSSPEVTASAEQSYDLIWHRGKLAVSLRNSSTNHTLIRKITPGEQETTANLDAAKVGDILVAINWDDVTSLSYDKIITRLKNRDFPLTLSFKRMERKKPDTSNATTASEPAALPRGDFEVMWREGKLGVKIHCDPDGRAMVRERTVEVADPDLAKIQAGDELIYVNDLRVKSIGYSEALVHMKKPKPIKLRFRRPQPVEVNLDEAMAASNSPRQSIAEKVVDPSQEGEMYSVEWTGGSLGITLRMNESYEIYIAQLTGKGLSLNYPSMRVVPVKQVDEAQILSKAVEPLTPPSNPHIDPWSKNEAYKVSTVLGTSPGTPTFVLDAPHAVVSPIVAAAIVSPPGTPHAAPFGSVTDQSFEHESTPPSFTNSATSSNPAGNHGWHYDDVDMRYESIADLHDFRNTSNSSFSTPLEGMPTQFYSSPPNTVNKGNANSQLVEPNQFGHNSSVAQSDFAYASANAANQYADLSWDISRENRTPTHNTPTAASSMVPLYSARSESVGSMDSMDICDQMSSASSDFMSSRSLATSDAFASNDGSKPLRFTTVSLDDGEVDIDDDDDSVQQDYSTIAPEDVPVLSMSSTRSMISSISSPPSPVPIPASISNEPVKTLYSVLWRGGPLGLAIKRNKDDEICVKALTGGGLAGMSDIIQAGDVLVQCGTTIVQHFTLAETSKVLKEAKTPVSLVFMRRGLPERPVSSGRMSGTSTFTPDTFTNSYDNLQYLGVSSPGSRDSAMTEDPMMSSRTLNDFTMSSRTPVFMPKRLPSNRHSTVFSIVWEGGPLGIAVTKNSDDENCVMRLTGDGLAAQSTIIQVGDVLVAAGDMQVSKLSLTAALQVIQLARKPTFLVFRRGGGADEDV
ncbi:unnamed protein product [Aphanomyces euteiches]